MNQPLEMHGYGYELHEFIIVVAVCALISIIAVLLVQWILTKAFRSVARWWERLEWWFWRQRTRARWNGSYISIKRSTPGLSTLQAIDALPEHRFWFIRIKLWPKDSKQ